MQCTLTVMRDKSFNGGCGEGSSTCEVVVMNTESETATVSMAIRVPIASF